jgi:hypothetical protein
MPASVWSRRTGSGPPERARRMAHPESTVTIGEHVAVDVVALGYAGWPTPMQ